MHTLLKPLNHASLRIMMLILLVGLTAAGCGSSGSSTPQPRTPGDDALANSDFYGVYQVNLTVGECDPISFSVTIGNDASLIGVDDYIYLPGDEVPGTPGSSSVSRSDATLTLVEEDGDYQQNITIEFAEDLASATVSGTVVDDECSGAVSGTVTLITRSPAEIRSHYLQYRSYADIAGNRQAVWAEVAMGDQLLSVSELVSVGLYTDNDEVGMGVSPADFSHDNYYFGTYNQDTGNIDVETAVRSSAGLGFQPREILLSGQSYVLKATIADGDSRYTVFRRVIYPGDTATEAIDLLGAEMNAQGGMDIIWEPLPAGAPQALRVTIMKLGRLIMGVDVPASDAQATALTIPAETMALVQAEADAIPEYGMLSVQVQTRLYTDDGMNYARGYSNLVEIPDSATGTIVDNTPFYGAYALNIHTNDACDESFSVTIGNDLARACISDYIYLPVDALTASGSCGTITRTGNTLTVISQDTTQAMTLDMDKAEVSGTKTTGSCPGDFTGSVELITHDPMAVQFSYITSVYDSGGFDKTVACIALSQSGSPISQGDIVGIRIYNSGSAVVAEEGVEAFQSQSTRFGTYSGTTSSIEDAGILNWAGLIVSDFLVIGELPPDTYTVYVLTTDGYTVSSRVDFPGVEAIPVLSGARSFVLENDTGMTLSWTLSDTDFDELFVSIYKTDDERSYTDYVMTIRVDPADNVSQIAIPQDVVQTFYETGNDIFWIMELQTRRYSDNAVYTSGYSIRSMTVAPNPAE